MSDLDSALRHRRFLLSPWPWRSLAYVLTTILVAAPVAVAVWTLGLPWLVAVTGLRAGDPPGLPLIVLMGFGGAVLVVAGPLVAIPLAALERRRLELIDDRPLRAGHGRAPGDPVSWLRLRYTEAATWREVAYGLVLALLVPAGYGVLGLLVLFDAVLIAGPALAVSGVPGWQVGPFRISGLAESVPVALLGIALVLPLGYLVGLVAAAQAALARALLGHGRPGPDIAG